MSARRVTLFLAGLTPEALGALLQYEHPQVGAVILSLVPDTLGARALEHVTAHRRADLALRLVLLTKPHDRTWLMLANSLPQWKLVVSRFGEVNSEAQFCAMLGCMTAETQARVIDDIREYDPDLAQALCDKAGWQEPIIAP